MPEVVSSAGLAGGRSSGVATSSDSLSAGSEVATTLNLGLPGTASGRTSPGQSSARRTRFPSVQLSTWSAAWPRSDASPNQHPKEAVSRHERPEPSDPDRIKHSLDRLDQAVAGIQDSSTFRRFGVS